MEYYSVIVLTPKDRTRQGYIPQTAYFGEDENRTLRVIIFMPANALKTPQNRYLLRFFQEQRICCTSSASVLYWGILRRKKFDLRGKGCLDYLNSEIQ